MQGRFITVEGGEGAGKSTMMAHIMNWLEQHGHRVVRTREPGGTQLAETIREILLDKDNDSLSDLAELLLVFASRAQHLEEVIRPALARGETVLCDRFTDATWAYQGGGRRISADDIATLEELVHGDLQPNLTLLLDLPVEQGMSRAMNRSESDRFESESSGFFHDHGDGLWHHHHHSAGSTPSEFRTKAAGRLARRCSHRAHPPRRHRLHLLRGAVRHPPRPGGRRPAGAAVPTGDRSSCRRGSRRRRPPAPCAASARCRLR